ncbi:MAG: cell division protein FtsQ [Legionellales bacterium RIFCSPHIGHO2_12_FULL_42_9]|nr:MAG: cell division protein FtsQ [Legionellales bacterium RIFCSPHIGHO2_12_FULL_42_9]
MDKGQWQYRSVLFLLIMSALALTARATYLYLASRERFPINTVKITATYHHISRQKMEGILSEALSHNSFFTLPVQQLRVQLQSLPWTKTIRIERIWPDLLKINLVENNPVAIWNDVMLMEDGKLFNPGSEDLDVSLPHLRGPDNQQQEVLQVYQKMSKILSMYGFYTASLEKRNNQAWELILGNGVRIHLGKRDLDAKIIRFCKAYPAVFSGKLENLVSVDLRYPRGMAVKWRGASNK